MSLLLHINYIVRSKICFVLNEEYFLRNTKQLVSQIEIYNITNLELNLAILYNFITLPLGHYVYVRVSHVHIPNFLLKRIITT